MKPAILYQNDPSANDMVQPDEAYDRQRFLENLFSTDDDLQELLAHEPATVRRAVRKSCDFGIRLGVNKFLWEERTKNGRQLHSVYDLGHSYLMPRTTPFGLHLPLQQPIQQRLENNPVLRKEWDAHLICSIYFDVRCINIAAAVAHAYAEYVAACTSPNVDVLDVQQRR